MGGWEQRVSRGRQLSQAWLSLSLSESVRAELCGGRGWNWQFQERGLAGGRSRTWAEPGCRAHGAGAGRHVETSRGRRIPGLWAPAQPLPRACTHKRLPHPPRTLTHAEHSLLTTEAPHRGRHTPSSQVCTHTAAFITHLVVTPMWRSPQAPGVVFPPLGTWARIPPPVSGDAKEGPVSEDGASDVQRSPFLGCRRPRPLTPKGCLSWRREDHPLTFWGNDGIGIAPVLCGADSGRSPSGRSVEDIEADITGLEPILALRQ